MTSNLNLSTRLSLRVTGLRVLPLGGLFPQFPYSSLYTRPGACFKCQSCRSGGRNQPTQGCSILRYHRRGLSRLVCRFSHQRSYREKRSHMEYYYVANPDSNASEFNHYAGILHEFSLDGLCYEHSFDWTKCQHPAILI